MDSGLGLNYDYRDAAKLDCLHEPQLLAPIWVEQPQVFSQDSSFT